MIRPMRIREIRRIQSADWLEFLKAPWSTGNVAFADLVRKPGFQLLNLSSLETPLVKVEFKYTPSADEIRERSVFQPIWALRGGVLKFDQFRHWCLIESDVNVEPERGAIATEHTKIEYDAKDSQALCPNRVLRTLQHPKYSLEWAFHVHKFQHRIVDDREMSLAAFGLPELGPREFSDFQARGFQNRVEDVQAVPERRSYFAIVGLIVGLGLLVTIFCYRRISRANLRGSP